MEKKFHKAVNRGLLLWREDGVDRAWLAEKLTSLGVSFAFPEPWMKEAITSEGLEHFSHFERSESFAETRLTMLAMQNRQDFTGTFRVVDRDVEIRALLLRIFSKLLIEKFDFGVFGVTPHDHEQAAIEAAMRWLGIPVLFFQPSLVGPQSAPRTSLTTMFDYEIPKSTRKKYSAELAEIVRLAESSIERLEAGGGTPKMSNQMRSEIQSRSFMGRLRAIFYTVSRLRRGVHQASTNFSGHSVLMPWFTKPLEIVLNWSLRKSLVNRIFSLPSEIPDLKGKFALFALHYEPERCSIPEGYPFQTQIDAVLRARALLPDDVVLIVKEHFSQSAASLRGILGRGPETYHLLEDTPGIRVVGIKANTPKLISKAECVFTLTGKVGIEAALKQIPVVFGGQPWWHEMPGSLSLASISSQDELSDFLSSPQPSRDRIFDWLSSKFKEDLLPILGDYSVERYVDRISPLPPRYLELQTEVAADTIHTFVTRVLKTDRGQPR